MRRLTRCYNGPEERPLSEASTNQRMHVDNDESGSCESAVLERLIEDVSAHVVVSDRIDNEDAQDGGSPGPAQVKPSSKRSADADGLGSGCQKSIFGQRNSAIPRAVAGVQKRSPTPSGLQGNTSCWSANCSTSSSSSISSSNTAASRAAGVRSRNSRPGSRAGTDKRDDSTNGKLGQDDDSNADERFS